VRWVGGQLIAADNGMLAAFTSPTAHRALPTAGGSTQPTYDSVIAVSLDHREMLVDSQSLGPGGGGEGAVDRAELIRLSDGRMVGSRLISHEESVPAALGAGDWRGEAVISPQATFSGGAAPPYPPGLGLLTVAAGDPIRLRWFKPVLDHRDPFWGQDKASIYGPEFTGRGISTIEAWLAGIGTLYYVTCNLDSGRCERSRNLWRESDVYTPAFFLTPSAEDKRPTKGVGDSAGVWTARPGCGSRLERVGGLADRHEPVWLAGL
jgi:hypothetical protein